MRNKLALRALLRIIAMTGERGRLLASFWTAHYVSPPEPELAAMALICERFKVDTTRAAIDVGANYGVWTRALQKRFRSVIAVEPNPQLAKVLRWRLGVEVIEAAASGGDGWATLWIPRTTLGELAGWASLDPANCPEAVSLGRVEVRKRLLDDVIGALQPSFMKIDVEGHEVDALMGCSRIMAECRPVIVCEVRERNQPAVSALMTERGYTCLPSSEIIGTQASGEMHFMVPRERPAGPAA